MFLAIPGFPASLLLLVLPAEKIEDPLVAPLISEQLHNLSAVPPPSRANSLLVSSRTVAQRVFCCFSLGRYLRFFVLLSLFFAQSCASAHFFSKPRLTLAKDLGGGEASLLDLAVWILETESLRPVRWRRVSPIRPLSRCLGGLGTTGSRF